MSNGAVILVLVAFLALLALLAFQASRIYAEGGFRPFFWPSLDRGYEVGLVTRLAAVPWLLVMFLLLVNGCVILLFDHDLLGRPARNHLVWLAGAAVPMLMIHLVDYQRSVAAAAVSFVVVAVLAAAAAYLFADWPAVILLLLPLLLWSLNGVRATYADRVMG